jgi:hypothetical protein
VELHKSRRGVSPSKIRLLQWPNHAARRRVYFKIAQMTLCVRYCFVSSHLNGRDLVIETSQVPDVAVKFAAAAAEILITEDCDAGSAEHPD